MTATFRETKVDGSGRTPPHLGTLVVMAGVAVSAMNIFLPMLPAIGDDFNVSPATTQYVLTLFFAATAIAQLFIGPLADRYGRRPVPLTTSIIFRVATAICVLATSIEMLLFGPFYRLLLLPGWPSAARLSAISTIAPRRQA